MKHELSKASDKYGAQMGRSDTHDVDPTLPIKVQIIQLLWEDECYDTGGAYWGSGGNIYHVLGDDLELFVRATSFTGAEAEVRIGYPLAEFTREVQESDEETRYASFNHFEIAMTLTQAKAMGHSGQCDTDVAAGREQPLIAAQLEKIDPADLRKELREYGSWDAAELADHSTNLDRILWLAAGQIVNEEG